MIDKVKDFISRHSLLRPGQRVIAGLSGGTDSCVLAGVLCALGYDVVAAHFNFRLRGRESERDRRHAAALAARLGVEFVETSDDAALWCRSRSMGLEEGCRQLRYGWFSSLAEARGCDSVAVAHHRDDQVETFFLNLLRSAGLRGLKGMEPRRGLVVRPLLGVSRAEIESYAQAHGLTGMTDSSNLCDDFTRNRLRHHVLPALRKASPWGNADAAVAASMANIDADRRLLDALVGRRAEELTDASGAIDIAAIAAETEAEGLMRAVLGRVGIAPPVAADICRSVSESGRIYHGADGRRWLADRGFLRPYEEHRAEEFTASSLAGLPLKIERTSGIARSDNASALFPPEVLDLRGRWEWRPWRRGDRIRPMGMAGSRAVSDILADAKVALDRKAAVRVLVFDGRILWVEGLKRAGALLLAPGQKEAVRVWPACTGRGN